MPPTTTHGTRKASDVHDRSSQNPQATLLHQASVVEGVLIFFVEQRRNDGSTA